jgi:GTPase SAR1 family protein
MAAPASGDRLVVKLIVLGCANVGKTSLMKVRGDFLKKDILERTPVATVL